MPTPSSIARAALALSLAGCWVSVDYTGTQFRCDDSRTCPEGVACIEGVCGGGASDAGQLDGAADAPSDAGLARCPEDCAPIAGDVLCLCTTTLRSWPDARDACAAGDFSLARIANAVEAAQVSEAVKEQNTGFAWLGGSDSEVEGIWRWLEGDVFWFGDGTGGPPVGAFANFGLGEPNDAAIDPGEDCLGSTEAAWNDAPCMLALPYVCARP